MGQAFSVRRRLQEVQAIISGAGAKAKAEMEAEAEAGTEVIASRAAGRQRQNKSGDRLG